MREMLIQLDVDAGDRRWQERANCLGVDPDLFFPERGASTKEAKAVCGGCEVVPSASSTPCATARSSASGADVRAGAPPDPPPTRPRPPRPRQRLTRPSVGAREADRPATSVGLADPDLDRRLRVEAGSIAGNRRCTGRDHGPGIRPTSSTPRHRCRARRASSRTCRHASCTPVWSRSTRFIDTCGRLAVGEEEAQRAHAAQPADRSRISRRDAGGRP